MEKEKLIQKWLNDELDSKELHAFKSMEDYDELMRLSNALTLFKAQDYDTSSELNTTLARIKTKKENTSQARFFLPLLKIAAVFVLCFGLYHVMGTIDTSVQTIASEKTTLDLPDTSNVMLNAETTLTYNKRNWSKERQLTLDGEAYFKVAKGTSFTVQTTTGAVTVLGTEFNVIQRDNYFEVVCYEGSVRVTPTTIEQVVLSPGDRFLSIDGKKIATEKENLTAPSWIADQSTFKSTPLTYIIKEFERQYNVTVLTNDIDLSPLFTGSFTHKNKEQALQAITLPMHLKYTIKNESTIVLANE